MVYHILNTREALYACAAHAYNAQRMRTTLRVRHLSLLLRPHVPYNLRESVSNIVVLHICSVIGLFILRRAQA